MPTIQPQDACKITNNEDYPITIGWDNIQYELPPGVTKVVPADAVINYFGDPRCVDNMQSVTLPNGIVGWVPDRQTEVRRLRSVWANHDGDEGEVIAPNVTITTVMDEEVIPVTADPKGENVSPASFTISDKSYLEQLVEHQQKQLDALMRQLGNPSPVMNEDDLPEDTGDVNVQQHPRAEAKPAHDDSPQVADNDSQDALARAERLDIEMDTDER